MGGLGTRISLYGAKLNPPILLVSRVGGLGLCAASPLGAPRASGAKSWLKSPILLPCMRPKKGAWSVNHSQVSSPMIWMALRNHGVKRSGVIDVSLLSWRLSTHRHSATSSKSGRISPSYLPIST